MEGEWGRRAFTPYPGIICGNGHLAMIIESALFPKQCSADSTKNIISLISTDNLLRTWLKTKT